MSKTEIEAAIPHRPPFLFVDEIVSRGENRIVCRKQFTGEEWFFTGHYPDYPLVPGVILCEAALQAGAILLADREATDDRGLPVVTRMNDVRYKHVVRPGDTIDIEVQLRDVLANAFYFDAKVSCGGKLAARLEFACMMLPANEAVS